MADKNDFIAASGIMAKFEAHAKGLEASVNREYRAGLLKGYEFICEEEPADVIPRKEAKIHTVVLYVSPDSQDRGRCSECGSCCAIGDNYCSYCGGKIVGTEQ